MKNRKILLYLSLSGILGSFLMFIGDMLFYYEPVSGADYNGIIKMSSQPIVRLMVSGVLGTLSIIFSITATFLFYLLFKNFSKILAKISFVSLASFFVIAGAYHAVFANFGFVGRLEEPARSLHLSYISDYLGFMYKFGFVFGIIWTILFIYFVLFKNTVFSKWILFFTPTLIILIAGIVKNHIPYPFGAIIYGGWINISFVMFYTVVFLWLRRYNNIKISIMEEL